MIEVIKVSNGSFNLFGTKDGMFILQGNLDADELKELRKAIEAALKEAN